MFEESKMTIFLCKFSKHFVLAYFALKKKNEEIWNFWPKPWTNFKKMENFRLF